MKQLIEKPLEEINSKENAIRDITGEQMDLTSDIWVTPSEKVSSIKHAQSAQIQIHSAHVQSLIQAFVLHG